MILKRGSVLGALLLTLIFSGIAQAQAQSQGVPARLAAVQAQLDQAIATIARLQSAVIAEAALRQASDADLATSMGRPGGGVTQAQFDAAIAAQSTAWSSKLEEALGGHASSWSAKLDAAVAAEAAARSAADAGLQGQIANEAAGRNALELSVAPLFALTPLSKHVSVRTDTINGLAGPHFIFTGANVHIRGGSGDSLSPNGLGNLIVGYNESYGESDSERGGSHNVVVGAGHRYNFGSGFVAGYVNRLKGMAASVTGGGSNEAAEFSTVSGGSNNQALGMYSTISGGDSNFARGATSSVSAGGSNAADGDNSSVTGGLSNVAGAIFSTVTGGANTINLAPFTVRP